MGTAIDTTTFTVALPADEQRKLICRYLSARKTNELEDKLAEAVKADWLSKERTSLFIAALELTAEKLEVEGNAVAVDDLDEHYTRYEIEKLVDEVLKAMVLTELEKKRLAYAPPSSSGNAASETPQASA